MTASDLPDLETPIGRSRRRAGAGKAGTVVGGSARGLGFRIEWDLGHDAGADGVLSFAVGGQWSTVSSGQPIDLAPLLGWLTASWDKLAFEHGYPYGVKPVTPAGLGSELASKSQLHERSANRDVFAANVRSFKAAHDLLSWLSRDGRELWVVREGSSMVLQIGATVVRWSVHDVVRTLGELGDAVAGRLANVGTCDELRRTWARRDETDTELALSVNVGLTLSEARGLVERRVLSKPANRRELLLDLDEVRAAARMAAPYVSVSDLPAIATAVGEIGSAECPELDALSEEAIDMVARHVGAEPYRQGYELALWLRGKLGMTTPKSAVDPHAIVEKWGVRVIHTAFADRIEAICVWGPRHGPAVLLNTLGRRYAIYSGNALGGGTRATLAHEMCHLLVDRGSTLPVVDVLGGATPRVLEQRANAFAAEFLMPREHAMKIYRSSSDGTDALRRLTQTFQVTNTLAALHMKSCENETPGSLSEKDLRLFDHVGKGDTRKLQGRNRP